MKFKNHSGVALIPFALIVIQLIEVDFIKWAFAVAVDHLYPDLSGLIDLDNVDAPTLELLNAETDDLIVEMLNVAGFFQIEINKYALVYGFDLEDIFQDQEMNLLAMEFYKSLIYVKNFKDEAYGKGDLTLFALSATQVIYYLCELVIMESYKLEFEFITDGRAEKISCSPWEKYKHVVQPEFRLLANLMSEVYKFNSKLKHLDR